MINKCINGDYCSISKFSLDLSTSPLWICDDDASCQSRVSQIFAGLAFSFLQLFLSCEFYDGLDANAVVNYS